VEEYEKEVVKADRKTEKELREWEKECNDIDYHNDELCIRCHGKTISHCFSCGGKGLKNDDICSKCKGKGEADCECRLNDRPGKAHQRRNYPDKPLKVRPPTKPIFPPISSINFRESI